MTSEICDKIAALLQGKIPEKVRIETENSEERHLAEGVNQLVDFMKEIHEFIFPLSKGELHNTGTIRANNYLASPFKELHSRLLHLTWQAGQVAKGDYSQRVDFMGDFSEAFNCMVVSLEKKEQALHRKIAELENAAAHIKKLEGVLPICANCKKIRLEGADPKSREGWVIMEKYIEDRSDVTFTHSVCPQCAESLYPDLVKRLKK